MGKPYEVSFQKGAKVKIISEKALKEFEQNWKFHNKLQPEQMTYGDVTALVKEIGF